MDENKEKMNKGKSVVMWKRKSFQGKFQHFRNIKLYK